MSELPPEDEQVSARDFESAMRVSGIYSASALVKLLKAVNLLASIVNDLVAQVQDQNKALELLKKLDRYSDYLSEAIDELDFIREHSIRRAEKKDE